MFLRSDDVRLEVLIRVLELGLHNRKRLLQDGVAAAGREMGPQVDAILLGYGLCGNALENPTTLLAGPACRFSFPGMRITRWTTVWVLLLAGGRLLRGTMPGCRNIFHDSGMDPALEKYLRKKRWAAGAWRWQGASSLCPVTRGAF